MAFVERLVEIAIKLAPDAKTNQPNTFSESGTDSLTLKGFRTSARIMNSGTPVGSEATVDVWGMTPSVMNQLATLGLVFNIVPRNTITITAGDARTGMATVFGGTITAGYGDYNAAPDVPFRITALAGAADLVTPTPASSFTGSTSVATIMAGLARKMGYAFENNGITAQLSNPVYNGSARTQMLECAADAGINVDIINGSTLAIWPKGGNRNTPTIPVVAPPPDGTMIGYPSWTQQGIIVKNLFDPTISFGGLVKVKSSLKQVDEVGTWAVYKLDLALDSKFPRGQWMQTIYAYNPKYPRVIPQQV